MYFVRSFRSVFRSESPCQSNRQLGYPSGSYLRSALAHSLILRYPKLMAALPSAAGPGRLNGSLFACTAKGGQSAHRLPHLVESEPVEIAFETLVYPSLTWDLALRRPASNLPPRATFASNVC